jgi:hypothetical protein
MNLRETCVADLAYAWRHDEVFFSVFSLFQYAVAAKIRQ